MKPTLTRSLEAFFLPFRNQIIGIDATFQSPYGTQPLVYADWIASGRLYGPIETQMRELFGPMVGNTHSESTETGRAMTLAYHQAHQIIKRHVNAHEEDVIITSGGGMTGVVAKFQRILGMKYPEHLPRPQLAEEDIPVVFLTHMEHHSNQTTWLESLAEVVILPPNGQLLVDPESLHTALQKYANRKLKIGSFSACSNVTGLMPPYHELAAIMHEYGGYCFVDFAASAPYVDINMHPEDPAHCLDAVFFSPHKFLGGPGSAGVLVFNKKLYKNRIPDHPGGGTVRWTNPWGEHAFIDDIEIREDGGTPCFLQAIRAAMAIRLKEQMGVERMEVREKELLRLAFDRLRKIEGLHILASDQENRLGILSFYVDNLHHNLIVRLLNDRFGIQVRGGCSCAGTYGHFLLQVDPQLSRTITCSIDEGDLSMKPGWVRLSLHPTMTNEELQYITDAIQQVVDNAHEWKADYRYCSKSNEFFHQQYPQKKAADFDSWFDC